jgi:predicted enzyme related to lactoylglutathione lyase
MKAKAKFLIGLDFVYLFTSDLAASRDWYRNALGIEPTIDMENFAEFRPADSSGLCLHPADAKSPLSTGGSVGYWRVINLRAAIEHFQKHGAKIYRGPLDIGNGQAICQMIDPIGNVIGFVGLAT